MPDGRPGALPQDPQLITPRQLVADHRYHADIHCPACRGGAGFDFWNVHAGRADTPIAWMRFACRRCGAQAQEVRISWQAPTGLHDDVCTIRLTGRPRAYGT